MSAAATIALEKAQDEGRIKLSPLAPEMALQEWKLLAEMFDRMAPYRHGRWQAADLRAQVTDGTLKLYVAWDIEARQILAVFGCTARQCPTGVKVFQIAYCAGEDLHRWKHLWPALRQTARDQGFDQIEITGRPGWQRVVPSMQLSHVVLVEDLYGG